MLTIVMLSTDSEEIYAKCCEPKLNKLLVQQLIDKDYQLLAVVKAHLADDGGGDR